jgi:general secretion pathway protein I
MTRRRPSPVQRARRTQFVSRDTSRRSPSYRAFTLLEVLVAVAILAVGMTVLLQVQARSALLAEQAKAMTVATQLARSKLYDCEVELLKRGFSIGDFKEEGKFDEEGYDDFFWECHGYKPELPMPDAADFQQAAAAASTPSEDGEGGLLGGMLGGGAAGQPGVDPAMMGAGMGMIGPVLTQVSEIVGESIRELTVVVRWRQGDTWDEMRVSTHLVDPTGVNMLAQQIQGMAGQLGAFTGTGGAGGAGGKGSTNNSGGKGNTNSPGNTPPMNPQIPGMRGAN